MIDDMKNMFYKCVACGRNGAKTHYKGKMFCSDCVRLFGTCTMCEHSTKCEFNDNPAPIPPVVTKHIRNQTPNGYMEQIIQVPNPQRIKAMCIEPKCICCDHDEERPHCMRQFGTCANYLEHEF